MAPNVGLEIKSIRYLGAQRLRKAILAAIYVYPAYIEYRRKFDAKTRLSKTAGKLLQSLVATVERAKKRPFTGGLPELATNIYGHQGSLEVIGDLLVTSTH